MSLDTWLTIRFTNIPICNVVNKKYISYLALYRQAFWATLIAWVAKLNSVEEFIPKCCPSFYGTNC
jgi:hypothetical protein